jgi:hypothetical protein
VEMGYNLSSSATTARMNTKINCRNEHKQYNRNNEHSVCNTKIIHNLLIDDMMYNIEYIKNELIGIRCRQESRKTWLEKHREEYNLIEII